MIPLAEPDTLDADRILAHLDRVADELHAAGIAAETALAFGDRVEAISEQAISAACALIAMTTHGRSGIERLAIGSLTDALIRSAPVPVIAVRPSCLHSGFNWIFS
jgi:nucleotide-binding universal stress UspA family protein